MTLPQPRKPHLFVEPAIGLSAVWTSHECLTCQSFAATWCSAEQCTRTLMGMALDALAVNS